jgi:hypothetical protein
LKNNVLASKANLTGLHFYFYILIIYLTGLPMRKSSLSTKSDLSETIDVILKNLPDPKDNSVSTIQDEVLLNNKRVIYLAQKAKGSEGFYWNINLS